MTIIHAQWFGEQAIIPRNEFERLLELARRSEPVDVQTAVNELTTKAMMRLAEDSKAFDFWNEPGEDIYTAQDGVQN